MCCAVEVAGGREAKGGGMCRGGRPEREEAPPQTAETFVTLEYTSLHGNKKHGNKK